MTMRHGKPDANQWYLVASPQYSYVVPILDDGTGPIEYVSDVVYVLAGSRRDAIGAAVMCLRKWYPKGWVADDNPFSGDWTVETISRYEVARVRQECKR